MGAVIWGLIMKRLFFFWIMYPLDFLADVVGRLTPARGFEPCSFGFNQPGISSQRTPLSSSQLFWCDSNLRHFKSMREQAEKAKAK